MDEAKKLIAQNLGVVELSYKEMWEIIDVKGELQLYRHFHIIRYYLNSQF